MSNTSYPSKRLTIFVSLFLCLLTLSVCAETVYRYKDNNGKWHFTNRKEKAPEKAQQQSFISAQQKLQPQVVIKEHNGVKQLVAINPYYGPVQAVVVFNDESRVSAMVEARGEVVLLDAMTKEQEIDRSGFVWGEQINDVPASLSLGLPVAKLREVRFSQAFNGSFSHNRPASRYAVDIPMNVGSNIHAAKEGIVMMVKDDYHMVYVSHNAGYFWPSDGFKKYPGLFEVKISPPQDVTGKTAKEITAEAELWIRGNVPEPKFK